MRNIQVIDGALNCAFSFFQATVEEFNLLFSEPRQDIQYLEDIASGSNSDEIDAALKRIWARPIRKQDVMGVHAVLWVGTI